MIDFREAIAASQIAAVRELFLEYQAGLGINLDFQNFEAEVGDLPGDYEGPGGRLVLAVDGAEAAGCVALRKLTEDICEMKRLYVRPDHRGSGLGQRLAEHIISFARATGYRWLYLDTLPSMAGAQRMYERLGFHDIPPYRFNPIVGTRYLGLWLVPERL